LQKDFVLSFYAVIINPNLEMSSRKLNRLKQ